MYYGREFTQHERVSAALSFQSYFAHPYSSWERPTNENTNGLIRQYLPKKSSFANVGDKQTTQIMVSLNNRPRKCLDYSIWKYFQDQQYDGRLHLALESMLYCYGIHEQEAIKASRNSYDEATEAVERLPQIKAPKRQVIEMAQASVADFTEFDKASYEPTPGVEVDTVSSDQVVLTTDGKGVAMRPEGLTEATQKGSAESLVQIERARQQRRKTASHAYGASGICSHDCASGSFEKKCIRERWPVKNATTERPRPQITRLGQSVEGVMSNIFDAAVERDATRQMP